MVEFVQLEFALRFYLDEGIMKELAHFFGSVLQSRTKSHPGKKITKLCCQRLGNVLFPYTMNRIMDYGVDIY
ncbi:unnamed protein product [Rhizophagus irregularis]|nr:unnamed protein product [Rhizophagus irregularis]CAB4418523.1 unnamed protein product [Rhizophagus irregularis]